MNVVFLDSSLHVAISCYYLTPYTVALFCPHVYHCNALAIIWTKIDTEAASPVRLVRPRPDHFSAGCWTHSQTAETVWGWDDRDRCPTQARLCPACIASSPGQSQILSRNRGDFSLRLRDKIWEWPGDDATACMRFSYIYIYRPIGRVGSRGFERTPLLTSKRFYVHL